MAEDWKSAYGLERMKVREYETMIVPALVEKVQALECELKVTRQFVRSRRLESALADWRRKGDADAVP